MIAQAQDIDRILADLPETIRRDSPHSIINSLATRDAHGAAEILGKFRGDKEQPYYLSDDSVRAFSNHPETRHVSNAAANVGEKYEAEKAFGRAAYDLQSALADLADVSGFTQDCGGTRMYLQPKDLAYQAAAWYVQQNPPNAKTVPDLFREKLATDPSIFAVALALEVAIADPARGRRSSQLHRTWHK
ncbi:hypothetical protein [uncultured Ruegeria sp.]|uniref:hypothetical protein n=1 Tax=uncultured Ruegeria sp. TaxID=259304 RepID=UPI0026246930|nr:hypothetical protein [uncultured Ruegeria sp.]